MSENQCFRIYFPKEATQRVKYSYKEMPPNPLRKAREHKKNKKIGEESRKIVYIFKQKQ